MSSAAPLPPELAPPQLRELLRAQSLVLKRPAWGQRHGRHRSLRAGVGVDFRDHRTYVLGDDPRMLDWRAIARRDRLVLRQTQAEDELSVALVLDAGAGMAYGAGGEQKSTFARAVLGGLAWLAHRQGDRVGLVVGSANTVHDAAGRPRGSYDHLVALAHALHKHDCEGHVPWPAVLEAVGMRLPPRSLVIVASDFLDPRNPKAEKMQTYASADHQLAGALATLVARQHDVLAVQVLHDDEVRFPWSDSQMLRFVDPRGLMKPHEGAAAAMRASYLERFAAHQHAVRQRFTRAGVALHRMVSNETLPTAFVGLLARLAGVAQPEAS